MKLCLDSLRWMADYFEKVGVGDYPPFNFTFLDPPYDDLELMDASITKARGITQGAVAVCMYPEDVQGLPAKPDRICHWIKPYSTKNTSKTYSRFVEVICFYQLDASPFRQDTHWFTRSGVFQDSFAEKQVHPFQKPSSLIEKLLAVHTYEGDRVLDPFCGSGVVHDVGERMGRSVTSIDIDPAWTLVESASEH